MKKILLFCLVVLAGFAVVLWATTLGIGLYSDSTVYLQTARAILTSHGLNGLTLFPPLYPVCIAMFSKVFHDPLTATRYLQALLLGANGFLVAWILQLQTGRLECAAVGAALTLSSFDILTYHCLALSEGLFLFITLCCLLPLQRFLRRNNATDLWSMSICLGLSYLVRYAGFAWIIASGILLWRSAGRSFRLMLQRSWRFWIFCIGLVGLWSARGWVLSGETWGRPFQFHVSLGWAHGTSFLSCLGNWVFLNRKIPLGLEIPVVTVFSISLLISLRHEDHGDSPSAFPRILASWIGIYTLFILFSSAFFQADLLLDSQRIFLPVHVLAILWFTWLLFQRPTVRTRLLVYSFVSLSLLLGFQQAAWIKKHGLGFAQPRYVDSLFLKHLRSLPAETAIFSNLPWPVTLFTGLDCQGLPAKNDLRTESQSVKYDNDMQDLLEQLHDGALIAYFNEGDRVLIFPSIKEIQAHVPLRLVTQFPDGQLYQQHNL